MQLGKQSFALFLIAILTLVPLGQTGPATLAAPKAAPIVLTTIPSVGSAPMGIAVDEVHNYIYVSAKGGNHLTRINGNDWSLAYSATSGVVFQPMGLAVDPNTQLVYVGNNPRYVSVVNGTTLQPVQAGWAVDLNPAGTNPQPVPMDVILNPSVGFAYVTDFSSLSRAYAVNINNYTAAPITINNMAPGGTKIALSPDNKVAYVTSYSANAVDVIDAASKLLVARYFGHYSNPVGIAVNPTNGYIYVANAGSGKVTVVDDRNDWKYDIIVGGSGATAIKGVAYNPNTNHIFVTQNGNPTGHVYVFDGTSYALIANLSVGINPDAFIAVDKTRNRVYVTNQGSGSVSVIQDTTSLTSEPPSAPPEEELPTAPDEPSARGCPTGLTDTVVGTGLSGPQGVALDDTHGKAYVANYLLGTISRVNMNTNLEEAVSVPGLVAGPSAVVVSSLTQRVYVANGSSTSISVLDGASLGLLAYVPLLARPRYIYMVPEATSYRAYVANHSDDLSTNYISEIDTFALPPAPIKLRDIAVGKGPYAVALSADRQIAYVSCHDSSVYGGSYLSIVDLSLGKEVGQFFTHYNQPTDIVMDPARDRIYVANEGSGRVVSVDHRNILRASVTVGGKPRGLALNPAFHRLAVVQKDASAVTFLDTYTFTQEPCFLFILTVDRWIAFSAVYNRYYASRSGSNTVAVIQDYVGDSYEVDNAYTLSTYILNDTPQTHTIDPAGDVDWVKFSVSAPVTLTLLTTDVTPGITPTLSLYDTDGTSALVTDTNPIVYSFDVSGMYYAKVYATDPAMGSSGYSYKLLLTGGPATQRIYLPLVMRSGD